MSDEGILHGDFHAVRGAAEAVIRQRAMFSDFGKILRSRSFYISDRAFRTKTNPHARTFQNFRRFYPNPLTFQGVLRIMKTPVNETASVSLRRDCDERTSVRSFLFFLFFKLFKFTQFSDSYQLEIPRVILF